MTLKQNSLIRLSDPDAVRKDDSGRSVAYFCRRSQIKVDATLVSELKEAAIALGNKNVRLCLHENPDAAFHEMINLEHRGGYYRPHKHTGKGESYHIIEGRMGAFIFDETGQVVDANVLDARQNFLYRVGVDTFHAVMPLSDVLIYHESKPGPFLREGDSIFPPWAPDGNDPAEVAAYTRTLLDTLPEG